MKKLTILWQRLLDDTGRTCPRCGETGGIIETSIEKLKKSFVEIGIDVQFIKKSVNFTQFSIDSLQSNRILINNKTLEEWIGASVGKSKCCDVCGDSDCRTLTFGHNTFETVPEALIIKASLLAAAELFNEPLEMAV